MNTRSKMDTGDEIPLEDHRYFSARLDHLEQQNPATLLYHLENGTLTLHLRELTARAMQVKASLIVNQNLPEDQAEELIMNQMVADPHEQSQLYIASSRMKLRTLLERYRRILPELPRTYQSQSETTE
jgi:hypothetical protein